MEDQVREALATQLALMSEPQIGTLVQDSMRQGQRMRAARRLARSLAVVGSLAAVAALATQTLDRSPLTEPSTAAASESASRAGSTRATPEAVLQLLLKDLPEGRTSHYAKAANGDLHVQAFLDDGSGPGLVRLAVLDTSTLAAGQRTQSTRSWTLPSGSTATVTTVPDDCLRSLHIEVRRPNGVVVNVDAGSCLAWDGFRLGRGRIALTTDQAISIADDQRLGFDMSSSLVSPGTHRFPGLAVFE
jgi:hypothetical protein